MIHRICLLLLIFNFIYADGVSSLKLFLKQKKIFYANFVQDISSKHQITRSSGKVFILRPNRFIWEYDTNNHISQKIISDGDNIYMIDNELEQVTCSKINKVLGSYPALILSGNDGINRFYFIKNINLNDSNLDWVSLLPRELNENNGFQMIEIAFDKNNRNLVKMNFIDNFGTKSTITFSNQSIKNVVNNGQFRFVKPKGYDLINN
jgi:outer membrane lipoprotein carrier protein